MKKLWFSSLLFLFSFCTLNAQLTISKIFSDNAVLQRGIGIPIWGTAIPGAMVKVKFKNQYFSVKANETGKWDGTLAKMQAGGPHSLVVSTESESITYQNILIGDVWLCSGQSNMEWTVNNANNARQEVNAANDSLIRHFRVPHTSSLFPQETLAGGEWEVCSPETVGGFTAVGYYFARELRKHQDVPIGLLHSSWGGSRIEPWMRAEVLGYKNAEESAGFVQAYIDSIKISARKELERLIGDLPTEDLGMKGDNPLWASVDYNHSGWKTMELPGVWESKGFPNLDGVLWYRKEIYLTKEETKSDLVINLGAIDDEDISYLNGQQIGSINTYDRNRNYTVPANLLKEGVNILTVRVYDSGWGGGFHSACDQLYYQSSKAKESLCGDWFFKIGQVELSNLVRPNQHHTLLYNFMIHPILDYSIKGALWYQGESNASIEGAKDYQEQFPTMIKDWRALWNCGEFPFLWVQLANWQAADEQTTDTGWARLREAQSMTLTVPNTAQAVIIDIGEADDIHPRNKQDVGLRLALGARKIAYGEDLVHSGPVYKSMEIEQDKIKLNFELFGSQLSSKNNEPLQAFAIAGADEKFYWAKASIQGNQIIVSSDQVPNPVAVRYAWANNPDKANLYNKAGIPASPFRTDNWIYYE